MDPTIDPSAKCKKLSTVTGACVLMSSLGYSWYWSNLQVYVLSYYIKYNQHASPDIEAPWVVTCLVASSVFAFYSSDILSKKIGKRLTTILAICVYEAGLLCAYFTIQTSIVGINVAFGVMMAFGLFLASGTGLEYVTEWFPREVGIYNSLVLSSIPVGALVMNLVTTNIINPDNLQPDTTLGKFNIFSQDELLNKVPTSLVVMAVVALVMGVVSILMMKDARENKEVSGPHVTVTVTTKRKDGGVSTTSTTTKTSSYNYKSMNHGEDNNPQPASLATAAVPDNSSSVHNMVVHTEPTVTDVTDLSPKQVIRSSTLYCGWFLTITGDVTYVILSNYYKVYGLTRIHDDHFVTALYTSVLVAVILSGPCCGAALDRFGLKITYISFFASSALGSLGFYFSLLVSPWCYAIFSTLFGAVGNNSYLIVSVFSIKAFGKTHFMANYALLMAPCVVSNVCFPPLFNYLSVKFGWFYLFSFCSCLNVLALIFTVVRLPNL